MPVCQPQYFDVRDWLVQDNRQHNRWIDVIELRRMKLGWCVLAD